MAPQHNGESGQHAGQRPLWWSAHPGQPHHELLRTNHTLMQPFIIFSKERSGTTWLLSMLRAQPEITAHRELLLWRNASDAIENILPRFLESGCHPTSLACGFKWFSGQAFSFIPNITTPRVEGAGHTALPAMAADSVQLKPASAHDNLTAAEHEGLHARTPLYRPIAERDPLNNESEWFCEWLLLHRFKVIVLEREGLERLVSKIKLKQTHVWRCIDTNCSAAAAAYRVAVNATTVVEELDSFANEWDAMCLTLRQRFPPSQLLYLTYHALTASPRHQMERIVSFLGVDSRHLRDPTNMSTLVKKMGACPRLVSNPLNTRVCPNVGVVVC